jgi:hypothetical protein
VPKFQQRVFVITVSPPPPPPTPFFRRRSPARLHVQSAGRTTCKGRLDRRARTDDLRPYFLLPSEFLFLSHGTRDTAPTLEFEIPRFLLENIAESTGSFPFWNKEMYCTCINFARSRRHVLMTPMDATKVSHRCPSDGRDLGYEEWHVISTANSHLMCVPCFCHRRAFVLSAAGF